MGSLKNPKWIEENINRYDGFKNIPASIFQAINEKLDRLQNEDPIVSVVISAWNEEINILNCISSLSNTVTNIPFEIIVVNNNSSDDTQKTIDKLHIRSFFQPVQGCGPARQMGQENAKGKYILLADADCLYPSCWIDVMFKNLIRRDTVCVYGRYSFISGDDFPRWKLFVFERLKDVIAEFRHFKRPYLNAYGISMGYIKELGLKESFVDYNIRGDDGRLCFDLMKYGKIRQVKSNSARVWTGTRTLQIDGSFLKALTNRIKIEIHRSLSFFVAHPPHNTKISKNE